MNFVATHATLLIGLFGGYFTGTVVSMIVFTVKNIENPRRR